MTNDIKALWGDTLRRVTPPNEIRKMLPEDTIAFLGTVGLPTDEKLAEEISRYLSATNPLKYMGVNDNMIKRSSPYFEFTPDRLEMIYFRRTHYVSIGREGEAIIGLRAQNAEVYLINGERPLNYPPEFPFYPVLFLNTTIEACLRFLMIYLQYLPALVEPTVSRMSLGKTENGNEAKKRRAAIKEMQVVIYKIESRFRSIDERALQESDSYWRFFLRKLRDF